MLYNWANSVASSTNSAQVVDSTRVPSLVEVVSEAHWELSGGQLKRPGEEAAVLSTVGFDAADRLRPVWYSLGVSSGRQLFWVVYWLAALQLQRSICLFACCDFTVNTATRKV
eukprot:NODE_605_length_787_cov_113.486450_g541_i0.p1 GENE.NODE_605_length_787_cov_113.486450_g541_i0~~NODE_605_length_787_cov_113.486450_g541_i0.p1  ORF type:complete len:113 (+),score=17.17 NODE_605_length_787_cov_113.486450_g541_i0:213-551(+)